ncbi:MAG TPA: SPFH domain-containing protein [Nitrososphaerales archaeon]|nr:SPFH domain-containing protein [Nitrososphaerales archaeon]
MIQSVLQIDFADPTTATATILIVIIVLVLFYVFLGRGIFLVRDNQIGVLTKKFSGQRMPQGQIIARKNQIGIQAHTLMPGLYIRNPIIWQIKKFPITEIGEEQVGVVESIDGETLPKARLLGDAIECGHFQDGEAFLDNHGKKGPQVDILQPGKYRINPLLFKITPQAATMIGPNEVAILIAQDGIPLPSDYIVAPKPFEKPDPDGKFPNARSHHYFQDGQAFIDSGGFRGPQQDTLQPGKYYINLLLFTVTKVPKFEVPPGFVAVLRSNVGKEIVQSLTVPTSISQASGLSSPLVSDVEKVLISDVNQRGIYDKPLTPGTYNLNTIAFTAYPVPTSAIMVDWADTESPLAATMSRPEATPTKNISAYPYLTDQTVKGISYFQFSQLNVVSKDGFQLEVSVRMIIRVAQENAAFVIARFGSVFNLISQIVHPLIDSSFRNSAGEKKALEFFQSRSDLQKEALERAKTEFEKYHVEAQNLLISYIDILDKSLLDTQTQKEIALQQQAQYQEQAKAQEQRIDVETKKANADKQPDVVASKLQITINQNLAQAQIEQAKGISVSTSTQADGQSEAIRKVGQAQADAYRAQVLALGQNNVAMVNVMDRVKDGKIQITPQTLVVSGGKDGDTTSTLFSAYLATLMQKSAPQQYKDSSGDSEKNDASQASTSTTSTPSTYMVGSDTVKKMSKDNQP